MQPFTSWANPRVFAGLTFLVLSFIAMWRASKTRELRPVAFGIAWFWIALFPSSSIFALAEVTNGHRVFFPFMGLTAAVVWWIVVRFRSMTRSSRSQRQVAIGAATAAILIIGVFAVATHIRNRVWLNDETLWEDVVKKSPRNGRGLMNYGLTQMKLGRYPKAKDYFSRAQVINPNYPLIYVNLAIVNDAMGDSVAPEPLFRKALQLEPNYVGGRYFYGQWLIRHARAAEAIPLLREAIALSPGELPSRHSLLSLYAAQGDITNLSPLITETLSLFAGDSLAREYSNLLTPRPTGTATEWFQRGLTHTKINEQAAAAADYRIALKLDSTHADAWNNLGWSLAQLGSTSEAKVAFERAIQLQPDNMGAKANIAWLKAQGTSSRFHEAFLLQTTGRSAEAIPIYNDLIATNPRWVNAHYNLGYALMTIGKCPDAIREFERTLALQSTYPLAHLHMSTCLGKLGRTADSVRHRQIYDQSLAPPSTQTPPGSR
jgi:tetratricopeptide (TPR) repeat protein